MENFNRTCGMKRREFVFFREHLTLSLQNDLKERDKMLMQSRQISFTGERPRNARLTDEDFGLLWWME